MNGPDRVGLEARVLLLTPTVKDAELTSAILARAGIACITCADQLQMGQQLGAGAGAVLIAEEEVRQGGGLVGWLAEQPSWSDLPVLILAHAGANSTDVARAMDEIGNVTVLERPTRVAALVSAVRTALRARQRQYQLRDQLLQRERVAEQLNMAMAVAQAGSWHFNETTGEFSASDRAIELPGLPPGTPLDHERALARVYPDDRASLEAALRRTLESGQPLRHEHRVLQPDGAVRWVSSHAERRLQEGQTCLIGHVQDVTERKQAEQALAEAERNYRALATASSEVAYRMSADWSTMMPLDGRQLVPSTDQPLGSWAWLHQNVPANEHPRVRQAIGVAIATKSLFQLEHSVLRPDGSIGWTFSRAVPILDDNGAVTAWFGAAGDITERKRAQEALGANEERLRMALAASQAGAWEWEIPTGRISWSPENYLLYGYDPACGPLAYDQWEQRIHPDDRGPTNAAVADAVAGRTPEYRHEFRVIHPARGQRWLLGLGRVEFAPGGELLRMTGINLDITVAKQAGEALRASEERLRLTMAATLTGLWEWDVATDRVQWSPECYIVHGMAEGTFDGTASGFDRLVHPDDRDRVWEAVRSAIEARTRYSSEFRIICPGGEVRWVANLGSAEYSPDSGVKMVGTVTDITLRKEAEVQRARTAALLNSLIASAPVGIALFDAERRFQHLNAPMAEMNGLPIADHMGKTVAEAIPDLNVAAQALFDRVLGAGETVRDVIVEGQTPKAPGETRIWRQTWFPVGGTDGGRAGVAAIVEEVTAQRKSEERLRESVERLRLATDAAVLGIHAYDMRTGRIEWDERVRALWGVPADEPINYDTFLAGLHSDDREPTQAAVDRAVDPAGDGRYAAEYRVVSRSDGAVRWVTATGLVSFEEGQPVRMVGTVQDVTERKRAEEVLRASEARLGGVLRQTPAGVVEMDAAGCMTLVNPRWCEMVGYAETELLGRSIVEITDVPFVEMTTAALARLAAGGPDVQLEEAYIRKDGSVLHGQSNVAAIRSTKGAFLGVISVVVDMTERLRVEEELRRLAGELTEADRRKDVFLATLAHELRNPLAPIRNGLQVLKLARNDRVAVEQVRTMMERQVLQLVRLVDDLLDVSRITQGKIELRLERVDLRAVIDAAVETSRPVLEQAGHKLSVDLADEPTLVSGDAARLVQVVSNLLNNSAKYTRRGGHVRLGLGLEREGRIAVLSVKDDGIGIPPAMLGRVFDMFTQVDRTLEKTTGGLGIGLSLVKGLMKMPGGSIEARSDGEGLGSEFVLRLPVVTADFADVDLLSGRSRALAAPPTHRILIVDDNVDAADMLGQALAMLGHEVRTAHDGEAGIAVAAQFRPDVVFLDIGMPKLNGHEAARRIRQHPWSRGMVLVALTGWGQAGDVKQSADAGFDHHLVKPVEIDRLEAFLSASIGKL